MAETALRAQGQCEDRLMAQSEACGISKAFDAKGNMKDAY